MENKEHYLEMDTWEDIQASEETARHIAFMQEALVEAKKALALNETPIGCVIVWQGKIIARGYNRRASDHSVLAHAEMLAIAEAEKAIEDWRLEEATLYVTLEPCPMCAGAIVQARIPRVVFATTNPKAGCAGSVLNVLQEPRLNHQVEIITGVMQEESAKMLKEFFKTLRAEKKAEKKIEKKALESEVAEE